MRSRSRSRDRDRRPRSRSPTRSKYRRDDDRKSSEKPYVKREPRTNDRNDRPRERHQDDQVRVKSEPKDSKGFGKVPEEDIKEPEKPTFELSGKLLEDTNVFNGVVIK